MVLENLQKYKVKLASNSPRRRELLSGLGIDYEIKVLPGIDETYPDTLSGEEIPVYIAREKEDACRMLRKLSGRTHQVITGVCLTTSAFQKAFASVTEVTFASLSEEEIRYYVSHYRPFDKAGAYGVQEWIGYVGVTGMKGSFYNVMGLPVQRLYQELKAL